MLRVDAQDKAQLIDPLFRAGPRFWLTIGGLLAIVAWGGYLYIHQLIEGLATTGLQRPIYWGVYMVNFIFLIGVSMAGTLVSAALTLTGASWRRPITRIAETVTVFGLLIAALQILFDMGRPERMLLVFRYGRLQSPLLWDVLSLSTYILASMFALYISLLPDLAILRDNYPAHGPAWRRQFYTLLALGWRGNRTQWLRLERVTKIVSVLIIPIGISLHTVTSWILATTVQPGWHSTILGPYFVVGAIFSGLGLLFVLLVAVRRLWRLQAYIGERQYQNLVWFLITMSAIWFYFTYTEHLTITAGQEEAEFPVMASKLWGADAPAFWGMVGLMVAAFALLVFPHLLPERWASVPVFQPWPALAAATAAALVIVLAFLPQAEPILIDLGVAKGISSQLPFDIAGGREVLLVIAVLMAVIAIVAILFWVKHHMVAGTVIASICIVVGMWLERWNIIVPTMAHPYLVHWSRYLPTMTEWGLMVSSFALFVLLFLLFFKLFPPVSIWEVSEGRVIDDAFSQMEVPMPEPSTIQPRQRRRFGAWKDAAQRRRETSWT
jgi:molybdopterin-containing oxidoreductase family membrane subunit